jgi:hypothetical protein
VFPLDQAMLNVSLDVTDLVLEEGSGVVDGTGKVQLTIDPHDPDVSISALIDTPSAQVSLGSGLAHGPHRLVAQAVFGDGTPYANPSARDHTVFFSSDGTTRPQIAIVEPGPGHVHVAGEPLDVRVISLGFDFVDNNPDCHVQDGCDPFNPDMLCTLAEEGCTQISNTGHAHIYLLHDYPDCLFTTPEMPVGCNENYIVSMRGTGDGSSNEIIGEIPGDRFPEAGEFTLSVGMQYNNHAPYPNIDFVVFDQIPITIIEK